MPIFAITDNIFAVSEFFNFYFFNFFIFRIHTFAPYDLIAAGSPPPTPAQYNNRNKYLKYARYVACKRMEAHTSRITYLNKINA